MKKMLISAICTAVLVLCSSCGIEVEQQTATNENELALAEQTAQEEYIPEKITEKLAKTDDVARGDSATSTMESGFGLTDALVKDTTANKSSVSSTKPLQCEKNGGSETSGNTMKTDSLNPVSTANSAYEIVETTETPKSNSTAEESYEQRMKAKYDAVVENAISDRPYNDVLKSTVSDDIILWYLNYTMNPWRSVTDTPVSMNDCYKIELIREIDAKRMYSIQKPESGGLFYSFYVSGVLQCTAYITKSLSFSDYSTIKNGSSINDVIAIEPATQAYINMNKMYDNLSTDGKLADAFEQHIILKDGLLILSYSRSEDTYKVNQINFFDDFKESIDWGMGYPCVYDYSILPNDYPA